MSMTGSDEPRWVTLREARDATGASIGALRRWYRDGLIASVTVPSLHGDQRLVDLGEVEARAAASPNLGQRANRRPAQRDAVVAALIDQVASMATEVQDLRDRVAALEGAPR